MDGWITGKEGKKGGREDAFSQGFFPKGIGGRVLIHERCTVLVALPGQRDELDTHFERVPYECMTCSFCTISFHDFFFHNFLRYSEA